MRKRYIPVIVLAIAGMVALASCTFGPGTYYRQPYGGGPGGGMMGSGMMGGGWRNYNPDVKPITIDQAAESARRYLNGYGGKLVVTEVMDFAWNYYAEAAEKDTGIHAMELIIDKFSGQVSPEMGPNTMWNAKYGMMGGGMMGGGYYAGNSPTAVMPVTPEQANTLAQQYLDSNLPGLTVAEADTFYGYYTLHTLKNGQVEGMLSVNGYSDSVWYHTWHGTFLDMKEYD